MNWYIFENEFVKVYVQRSSDVDGVELNVSHSFETPKREITVNVGKYISVTKVTNLPNSTLNIEFPGIGLAYDTLYGILYIVEK